MKKWCKIIELPEHDVLVERTFDEEEGECVRIAGQSEIGKFETLASFDSAEQANEFYSMCDEKVAMGVIQNLIEETEEDPINGSQEEN